MAEAKKIVQSSKKKVVRKTAAKASKTNKKPEASKQELAEKAAKTTKSTSLAGAKEDRLVPNSELPVTSEPLAKAGKHSAKAIKEAAEKQAKEERKATPGDAVPSEKPKPAQKTARPRLERQGKNFRKAAELIEKDKQYTTREALVLATKTSPVKFDATVELHVNLNVDPRQAEQNVRDTVVLPAGTGKKLRIAALTEDTEAAKKAGADKAGNEDLFAELDKGIMDFDVLIATPSLMPKLGKYARVLGPKGLMPSPKSGTVSVDVAKAVKEAKTGKVEYRVDSTGIIHLGIGKVSFGAEKLEDNARAVFSSIKAAKPSNIKGSFVRSITVTSTMGPGIKVASTELKA